MVAMERSDLQSIPFFRINTGESYCFAINVTYTSILRSTQPYCVSYSSCEHISIIKAEYADYSQLSLQGISLITTYSSIHNVGVMTNTSY